MPDRGLEPVGRLLHDGRSRSRRSGYREVHPLSRAGRPSRSSFCSPAWARSSTRSRCSWRCSPRATLLERRERKRLARMLDDLTDHFILCGFGRHGRDHRRASSPASTSRSSSSNATPSACTLAMDQGYLAVEADASNEDVLRRVASIARAAWSRRSAPTRRTSTRCSARACSSPTCSSSDAPRARTRGRS